MVPDYSLIIIGANMGMSKMTREHLGVSLFLKIPFVIVLTKIDIAPTNVY
jgi:GTPase